MAKAKKPPIAAKCGDCPDGGSVELVTGDIIYPHRPDLADGHYWRCACGAYVSCHPGTKNALGTCAGPETRDARNRAHAVFEPIWKAKMRAVPGCTVTQARNAAYLWLGTEMGLKAGHCHMSWMTKEQAEQARAICQPIYDRLRELRVV